MLYGLFWIGINYFTLKKYISSAFSSSVVMQSGIVLTIVVWSDAVFESATLLRTITTNNKSNKLYRIE